MLKKAKILVLLPLLLATGLLLQAATGNDGERHILQLVVEEAIGPATQDYLVRSLESAAAGNAELVVIRMDTPGGLDSAMRGIIKQITQSPVPVASYVAPTGARAASAGTYILYASHISAMAPGTNLGAATPVAIGGGMGNPGSNDKPGDPQPAASGDTKTASDSDTGEPVTDLAAGGDASKRKSVNDAAAYIRGLAELHGRNADWAEKAVREAASLSASEALEMNVIDIVASSLGDLLQQVDGREVEVQGDKRVIKTRGLPIRELQPDWRSRLLSVITNPNIAYILMLVGIYGLILEFSNPGAIVPGTVGAIALLLALYALQLLPINYAGIALILLGVGLMIGEAFQPSFGILGIGGVVAFVIGSVILMDTDAPGFGIDIKVIIAFALSSALIFMVIVGMAIRSRQRRVVSGAEQLVGAEGMVLDDFDGSGTVFVHSEHWQAHGSEPLHKGQPVRVTAIKGLTLEVEPLSLSDKEDLQ